MKNVDKYLRVLQEQFNARIALEDISGDFKDEWTDCYETRCHRRFENKYEKNICKDDCAPIECPVNACEVIPDECGGEIDC